MQYLSVGQAGVPGALSPTVAGSEFYIMGLSAEYAAMHTHAATRAHPVLGWMGSETFPRCHAGSVCEAGNPLTWG